MMLGCLVLGHVDTKVFNQVMENRSDTAYAALVCWYLYWSAFAAIDTNWLSLWCSFSARLYTYLWVPNHFLKVSYCLAAIYSLICLARVGSFSLSTFGGSLCFNLENQGLIRSSRNLRELDTLGCIRQRASRKLWETGSGPRGICTIEHWRYIARNRRWASKQCGRNWLIMILIYYKTAWAVAERSQLLSERWGSSWSKTLIVTWPGGMPFKYYFIVHMVGEDITKDEGVRNSLNPG